MKILRIILCAVFLALAGWTFTGCATDDSQNVSSIPWNTPQDWEGALPSNINQGR
ncbi:MAG TPA: hypothetical protein VH619_19625 [Verrucomicrobiae bacterium]|jgi:hypothetical protein|nr:hypothetical protein [Verrucomicrobiae bacterium]